MLRTFKKSNIDGYECRTDKECELNSRRLYREVDRLICNKNIFLQEDASELRQVNNQLQKDLITDGRKVFHTLNNVKRLVSNFRSSLLKFSQNELDDIKQSMILVESSFREYRLFEKTSLEELVQNEAKLWQECSFLNERIQSWEYESQKSSARTGGKIPKNATNASTFHQGLPKDIINFQKFLSANGGRTGGWAEFDHNKFVTIRRRYLRNGIKKLGEDGDHGTATVAADVVDQFVNDVNAVLCSHSLKAIVEHDAWFVRYQQLESAYKFAIEQYKIEKTERRMNRDWERLPEVNSKREPSRKLGQDVSNSRADAVWMEAEQRDADEKLETEMEYKKAQKLEEVRQRKLRLDALHAKMEAFRAKKEAETATRAKKMTTHNVIKCVSQQNLDSLKESRIEERTLHLLRAQSARNDALIREKMHVKNRIQRAQSAHATNLRQDPNHGVGQPMAWKSRLKEPKESTQFGFT